MVVTRFAPSPTGYLHIGGLRTALFNYLWARKNGGKFLLRIEDTDLKRNREEAVERILEGFKWVGLEWDGEVVYQSERFPLYQQIAERLLKEGKAYKCYLTPEELEEIRKAKREGRTPPIDIRKYREFEGELDKPYVIRFKTPLTGSLSFVDGVRGEQSVDLSEIEDFVLVRSDGTPTYNLAVVIDDHEMGVTEVIRGDDHLRNTFKQILLYRALGWEVPKFYHVPMIHNLEGGKMSKRDGAVDVLQYREEGYLPEALLNFLVRLGWSYGDRELFTLPEMIELFNPSDIQKSPARFDPAKLDWLNSHYIKNSPTSRLRGLLVQLYSLQLPAGEKGDLLIEELKERVKTLKEMKNGVVQLLTPPTSYNPKAVKKFIKGEVPELLHQLKELISKSSPQTPEEWGELIEGFVEGKKVSPRKVMPPLRIALTGDTKGIDLYRMLHILGKEEVLSRLSTLLSSL